jgi:hypothetical protein
MAIIISLIFVGAAIACWAEGFFQKSPKPQQDYSYETLRQQYIEEAIKKHSMPEIEHMIEHVEQALACPHNEIEYQVQRENLDILNTIYMEMLMRSEFCTLQNSQIS